MTNFEKWKDEILEITDAQCRVAVVDGKPVNCSGMVCGDCDCNKPRQSCAVSLVEWLYSEYKEPTPKLTKRERAFCEAFAFPRQEKIRRTVCGNLTLDAHDDGYHLDNTWFKFIKAGNPAWTVEDLLKLEVEE